ncbi:MAG: hypothetical protein ABFD91_16260 [Anaerohalosphaeraceae bacterium]
MLYERFKNENTFRAQFLRPLLTRLGFVAVAELHGAQEFGKDFVFSELAPFGFLRHYAAVVKHEKIINQTSNSICNNILSQVKQAFSISFRLPDSESVHRVSNVIVFNSGKISDNARCWLRSELDEEKYGRNVHLLDGERLFQLDMTSTFRQGERFIPRLQGIQHEIQLNLRVWNSILESLPSFAEGRGNFTIAMENFIGDPFLIDQIPLNDIVVYVQECRIIDCINKRYLSPMAPKGQQRDKEINTIKSV